MVPKLLRSLQNEALYGHRVDNFKLLETHISWILLTGRYAYKIKKPVNFEFVDFSTLSKRRYYCYEELRLNRRLAPLLYLDVCAVTGSHDRPAIDGTGPAIEYMVKMKQFRQQDLLVELVERNKIDHQQIQSLAGTIASFHQEIESAGPDSIYGNPGQILRWVEQNFSQITALLQSKSERDQLNRLHDWTLDHYSKHTAFFQKRKQQAFIRECHGDLHLGNIVRIDGDLVVFDGIEFNEELRWIDVISEIAFLMMDLSDKHEPTMANRFLDQYLTITGDYDGLSILTFYLVYRALVRAKVDLLKSAQNSKLQHHGHAATGDYQSYIDLASAYIKPQPAVLFITHGLAGSGKSTLAGSVAQELGVVRIRSDVERKRMFGFTAKDRTKSSPGSGIYTKDATHKTYTKLSGLCEKVLRAGYPVIIDAGFLKHWQRLMFLRLAQTLGVKFVILDLDVPDEELRKRVEQRWMTNQDPSEADLQILDLQLKNHQPLSADEQACTLAVDSLTQALAGIKNVIHSGTGSHARVQ